MAKKEKQNVVVRQPSSITLRPRTISQSNLLKALKTNTITFALGCAGTGKSYICMSYALQQLFHGNFSKIVITRPVVDAGESLGFLPGGLRDKMDPYLQPLYDVMEQQLCSQAKAQLLGERVIEIVPFAFMRGRTFRNSFVMIDEAQNVSYKQMKMLLSRIGEGSKYAICGDPQQADIKTSISISVVARSLSKIDGVESVLFDERDVVRHPLIRPILEVLDFLEAPRN